MTALAPLAAAARLRGRPGRFLLHSASDADGLGGWSFAGADPIATLEIRGASITWRRGDAAEVIAGDPLDAIERFCAAHGHDLRAPGDTGAAPEPRVIGWLGYELGHAAAGVRGRARGAGGPPDAWLAAYDAIARWRGASRSPDVVGPGAAALAARLEADTSITSPGAPPRFGALACPDDGPGGAAYKARVARILEYLRAGDVYQVNLARRLIAPRLVPGDPLALAAAIAAASPAPYAAFLEPAPGDAIVSASPERFLARSGDRIETRPIKGTRPRATSPAGDAAARDELARAPKDAAEHLMIVDLERNDLGRVAVTGSVRVDELAYVVELPTVHHLVSRVSAALRPDVGLAALLRATFPGGSITGAPKIRAMQIIDELEPAPRGPYCGAIGWLGAGGALDLSIAIRIAVLAGDELAVHVGGGIVADSDPQAELDETEAKAAGWRRALAMLAAGATA
jgi:para-aminobenzoate synthetase component 1